MPKSVVKILKIIAIFIFPLFSILWQGIFNLPFLKTYWLGYLLCTALLIYSYFRSCFIRNQDITINIRRYYFSYVLFVIMLIIPQQDKFEILNTNIWGLSKFASLWVVFSLIAILVYLLIVSDFHILEVTIGKTKISMLKEKYEEEIENHIDITNNLIEKIAAESRIMNNLSVYCVDVLNRLRNEEYLLLGQEYKMILESYYSEQTEDIEVLVAEGQDEINNLKEDYKLKNGELNDLKYRLNHYEVYNLKKDNKYYSFIPYAYVFESHNDLTCCIILSSDNPIIIEAETKIIPNILMRLADEILKGVDEQFE